MAIPNSNSIFNPAQQSTGILGAGFLSSGGTGSSMGMANSAAYQAEMIVDHNKQTNIRITHVENGFIVEVGSEARLIRKYVAKDMDEVRDLITSDMVTQRMEGK